jgi:hypothetical protein
MGLYHTIGLEALLLKGKEEARLVTARGWICSAVLFHQDALPLITAQKQWSRPLKD